MSRLRRLHPSPRVLFAALVALGLAGTVALALLPVDAAFGADPLLRLHSFANPARQVASVVDCGAPVANLTRSSPGVSLYALARDEACQRASTRRVAAGVAGGGMVAVLAALGLVTLARGGDGAAASVKVA